MAAQITVEATPKGDGWECRVTVAEQGSRTQHTVTITRAYLERLTGAGASAPAVANQQAVRLVEKSFEFLLEREPKESILRSFDLPLINRYFPEYETNIRKQF
jgi:hypothetical protein